VLFRTIEAVLTEALHSITDLFMLGKSVSTKRIDRSIIPIIDDPDDQMFDDLAYASNALWTIEVVCYV
jgi:predicted nucleic acid-binding protein